MRRIKKKLTNHDKGGDKRNFFDTLPDELVLKIFSYLSLDDVIKMGWVCSRFRSLSADKAIVNPLFARYGRTDFRLKSVLEFYQVEIPRLPTLPMSTLITRALYRNRINQLNSAIETHDAEIARSRSRVSDFVREEQREMDELFRALIAAPFLVVVPMLVISLVLRDKTIFFNPMTMMILAMGVLFCCLKACSRFCFPSREFFRRTSHRVGRSYTLFRARRMGVDLEAQEGLLTNADSSESTYGATDTASETITSSQDVEGDLQPAP